MFKKIALILASLFVFALPVPVMAAPFNGGAGGFSNNVAAPAYLQGAWTPGVTASSTAGTPAYTTQVGSYEQIGRLVHVQFKIVLSGWTGTPSGNVTITGLPGAATATVNDNGGCVVTSYTVTGLASTNYGIVGTIAPGTSAITLFSNGNTGTTNVTAAQTGTTPTLVGYCTYHI